MFFFIFLYFHILKKNFFNIHVIVNSFFTFNIKFRGHIILMYFKFYKENYRNSQFTFLFYIYIDFYLIDKTNIYPNLFSSNLENF